nr:uncharacterized protein LOC113711218 [Coffea arabica]
MTQRAKTSKFSNPGMTALHVAASCGQSEFVVEMVKKLNKKQLEDRDTHGCTAVHHVALAANVGAAKAMVEKNSDLPHLGETYNPFAAKWRHPSDDKKMVDYLPQVTEDKEPCHPFTGYSSADLIVAIISSGSYGKLAADVGLGIYIQIACVVELMYTKFLNPKNFSTREINKSKLVLSK